MKIAVLARSLGARPTGRGIFAREMVAALIRLGKPLDLHLFCGEDPKLPGVRFHRSRGGDPLSDGWKILRGIGREVASLNPDVFWGATHLLPGGLPDGLPVVLTALDVVWKDHPETMRWSGRRANRWMERAWDRADRVVCISEFTRSRVLAHWPKLKERATVICPGVSDPVPGRDAVKIQRPYILSVDTIEPRKNLGVIADAMESLPEFTWVHAGPVGWKSAALVRRMRKSPRTRMLGYVEPAALTGLYRGARAAVFPSIYEGFHLSPLEAMSAGAPVVASDISVHREVLGDAAVYVPPASAGELAAAIRGVEGRREELLRRGKERAGRYRWEESAARLHRVLEECILARTP